MDVLGLTFEQVFDAIKPTQGKVKELRGHYRRLMRSETTDGGPLRTDIAPIVDRCEDGDVIKFVQRLSDGLETECVVVPMERRGEHWKTLCVSSQVGCARGCKFCETAQLGFRRNMTAAEIVGQVLAARREFGPAVHNVVFMGMGEPLDNFDEVIAAIHVLTDGCGLSLSWRHVTISTVGLPDGIRRLVKLGRRRMNLAISLNAPNDEIRAQIMPVAKQVSMADLREVLMEYPLRNCQYFMIEYVLIPGVNDHREHAFELAQYVKPLPCMINVIPYNPRRQSPWDAPTEETIGNFIDWLKEAGANCRRRITKGRSQMAACGQLGNRLQHNQSKRSGLNRGTHGRNQLPDATIG